MKKWISILLSICLILSLAACSSSPSDQAEPAFDVDYGSSSLYSLKELEEAVRLIEDQIAKFPGCELRTVRYAGDESSREENVQWLNSLADGGSYTQAAEFLSSFHTAAQGTGAFEPDTDYENYEWWLARTAEGGWKLLSWGYGGGWMEAPAEWTRTGYFADENENLISITLMEDEENPGWYVGCMLGDVMAGDILPQEGNTLHGKLVGMEEDAEPFMVTVTEEGEDGVMLEIEGGETYHLLPYEMPEATIFVSVNVDGWGNIDYAEGEEAPEFDAEYPFQSAQINLAEPAVYTLAAWPDEGWHFVKWTKNGEDFSEDAEITVNLDESADFIAVFEEDGAGIDYLALVNKCHPLPEGWEDALEIVDATNSLGDSIEVEAKAYEAYLGLKEALAEEGVYIDLDSARRSVAAQQDIMDRFTEKYGLEYALKTVAAPGYSEHHTGLALDLYLNIDGKDVYHNEDMVQYPEIWAKIHAKLADYGFILRYLEGKEHITGYAYEPWHIRYVDDPEIAREIMSQPGMTLEVWLGAATDPEVTLDYGASNLYTAEELASAVVQIKCRFAAMDGCELHAIRYAGDKANNEENLKWINSMAEDSDYVELAEFLMDFHTAEDIQGTMEPDHEYQDYQWWLARTKEGGWEIVSWGY